MQITLPEKVNQIIKKLQKAGFEAYAVGGCVRDSILKREPEDWDITTSAAPWQVKKLFTRTIDTGIEHGTVTVLIEKDTFEVTTYRIDGTYEDNRHPKEITFTASLQEDLKRRDFTMNAMAYNEEAGLVDIFHGMEDMKAGCIRCVGNPLERFSEDALRLMRAIRFSAQLGYDIEEETKQAIMKLAGNLQYISAERIQTELVKLLLSPQPEYLKTAYETGVTGVILPEFDRLMNTPQNNPHHIYHAGEHTLQAVKNCRPNKILRLTMLLHDMGKSETRTTDEAGVDHFYGHDEKGALLAEQILKRLKMDNYTINQVRQLVRYHDILIQPSAKSVRRSIHKIGEDIYPLLLEVKKADALAQNPDLLKEKLLAILELKKIYESVQQRKECTSLKLLEVTGKDLINAGVAPGKEIGNILDNMLTFVIDKPENNNKEYLLKRLSDFTKDI